MDTFDLLAGTTTHFAADPLASAAADTSKTQALTDSRGAGGAVCAAAGLGWVVRGVLREPSGGSKGGCDLWVAVLESPDTNVREPWAFVLLHIDAPRGMWETLGYDAQEAEVRHALRGAVTAATAFDLFNLIDSKMFNWTGTTNAEPRCTWHTPPKILGLDVMCGVPGPDGDAIRMLAAFSGTSPPQFRAGGAMPTDRAVFDPAGALRVWAQEVDAHHVAAVKRLHRPGRTPVTAKTVVETLAAERNAALLLDEDLLASVTFLSGGINLERLLKAVDRWFAACHPVIGGRSPACACLHILNSRRRDRVSQLVKPEAGAAVIDGPR